jgi:hypothetical protein
VVALAPPVEHVRGVVQRRRRRSQVPPQFVADLLVGFDAALARPVVVPRNDPPEVPAVDREFVVVDVVQQRHASGPLYFIYSII